MKTIIEFLINKKLKLNNSKIPIYKYVGAIHRSNKIVSKNIPQRYFALISNESILDELINKCNFSKKDKRQIFDCFNDTYSKSKTSLNNVYLQPYYCQWEENGEETNWPGWKFYNDNKRYTEFYKYIEDISIEDFTKDYWIENYNK